MIVDKPLPSNWVGSNVLGNLLRGRPRRTLVAIPDSRLMAMQNIITKFDADVSEAEAMDFAGVAEDHVISSVNVRREKRKSPTSSANKYSLELLVEVLIDHICKNHYSDEEKQKKLRETIYLYFGKQKLFKGFDNQTLVPFRNHMQNTFEAFMNKAKLIIHSGANCVTLLNNSQLFIQLSNPSDESVCSKFILFNKPKYVENFTDIEKIGRGGGGLVYKAKNRVDECWYAIKLIPIRAKYMANDNKILQEAKVLASLTHPYIVNYKTAWLDYCTDSDCISSSESSPRSNTKDSTSAMETNNKSFAQEVSESVVFDEAAFTNSRQPVVSNCVQNYSARRFRRFRRSISYEETYDSNKQLVLSSLGNIESYRVSKELHRGQGDELIRFQLTSNGASQPFAVCQTVLVIQMELCNYTLRDWLDRRIDNSSCKKNDLFTIVDESTTMNVLKSILEGVDHFHATGTIHRDLKPTNIFFDKNDQIKIGDFGLAAYECVQYEQEIKPKNGHTSKIGTKPYAAPEQMSGRDYDLKSDMYSIGVITLELFHPFYTNMEKSNCLQKAKSGTLPESFCRRWPKLSELILRLLSENPMLRPTAKDILNSGLFNGVLTKSLPALIPRIQITPPNDTSLEELTSRMERLACENEDLKAENENLKTEVILLRSKILELEKEKSFC